MSNLLSKKNQSRRSGYSIIGNIFMSLLEKKDPLYVNKTQLEIICQKMIDVAKEGNINAANLIFNRIEGTPTPSLDLNQALQLIMTEDLDRLAAVLGIPRRELEGLRAAYRTGRVQEQEDSVKMIAPHPEEI